MIFGAKVHIHEMQRHAVPHGKKVHPYQMQCHESMKTHALHAALECDASDVNASMCSGVWHHTAPNCKLLHPV